MQRTWEWSVSTEPCCCLGQHSNSGHLVLRWVTACAVTPSRHLQHNLLQICGTSDAELLKLQLLKAVTGKHNSGPARLRTPLSSPVFASGPTQSPPAALSPGSAVRTCWGRPFRGTASPPRPSHSAQRSPHALPALF